MSTVIYVCPKCQQDQSFIRQTVMESLEDNRGRTIGIQKWRRDRERIVCGDEKCAYTDHPSKFQRELHSDGTTS